MPDVKRFERCVKLLEREGTKVLLPPHTHRICGSVNQECDCVSNNAYANTDSMYCTGGEILETLGKIWCMWCLVHENENLKSWN